MTRLIVIFLISIVLLSLGGYWKSIPEFQNPESVKLTIERNLNHEIQNWNDEFQRLSTNSNSINDWNSVNNSFYLQDSTGIIRWTTNKYLPNPNNFDSDSIEYYSSGANHYLVNQRHVNGDKILTGFLVLQEGYSIQNQFLNITLNPAIFSSENISFQASNNELPIQYKGRKLFSVSISSNIGNDQSTDWLAWAAFLIGLMLLLFIVWNVINNLSLSNYKISAVVILLLTLLVVRYLMVYWDFPDVSSGVQIFNPREFASSSFNNSIGNLFLNTFALFLVAIFTYQTFRNSSFRYWKRKSQLSKTLAASLIMLFFFAAQLLPFLYLETIYHNSVITPDISQQLFFDTVRLCALGCVLLSCLTGFIFSITFFSIASRVLIKNSTQYMVSIFVASILFMTYHYATDRNYEVPFLLTLANLVILVISSIKRRFKIMVAGLTSFILLELVIYGLQTSLAIQWLSKERELESMKKFGSTFLLERDVLGEYMLNQAISKIEIDAFIQQQMVNPFNRLNAIEHKIRHNHLNSYFDRYDIQISLYDNSGAYVGSPSHSKLPALIQEFVPLAENTGYKGIYIIKNPTNRLIKRYLAVVPIKYYVSGYVVIDMTLRQVLPSAVFPKLLLDNRFSNYSQSSNYSYAIFSNGAKVNSTGDFNYGNSTIQNYLIHDKLFTQGITLDGFDHVGIKRGDEQFIIISVRHYSFINLIANFSFYLFIGISLVLVGLIILYLISLKKNRLSYSNQIRIYVYLAMVLPLLVLAITILRVNSITESRRSEENSVKQARNVASSLSGSINEAGSNIEDQLSRQALSLGVDVTVYSSMGLMIASSQPDIYGNQILSHYIDPNALRLVLAGGQSFTIDDAIGKLKFRNTYSVILGSDNKSILGIISVPFFESLESFEKDQLRLVVNILAVFVVVFFMFYLLSYLALNWLIRPLKVVSSTLRQTTLAGNNKKLLWRSSDEIGTIVKEYNNMIDNLAKSREELESRQREATWREMARQVAHEIKNPLTPIKLILQQLQRSFISEKTVTEQTTKNITTVLQQVEILNDIASSFSAFAQMPEPKLERLDIINLIQEVVNLHRSNLEYIHFEYPEKPIWVMADSKLFSRIFSNIILNAIQSERDNVPIHININLKLNTPNITLLFKDNGKGIADEVKEKIFIPYFSTKDTGSGLGLAIAKQGIEQVGGTIRVKSKLGMGTTFIISLPFVM